MSKPAVMPMPLPDARAPGVPPWAISPAPLFPLSDVVLGRLPGFIPLDPADWLLRGPDAAAQAAERVAVLRAAPERSVAVLDEGRAPLEELEARVAAAVAATDDEFPVSPPDLPAATTEVRSAVRLSSLAVEDWVLLTHDERTRAWVISAGIVCFPAHWHLRDKIGLPMPAVHAPVPHYSEDLSQRVTRVLDRLRPEGAGVVRANWGIDPGRGPHAPPGAPTPWADAGPFLRIERQSLLKMPETGAIAFGIRTFLTPLAALPADQILVLREALQTLPADVRAYKLSPETFNAALACLGQ